MLTLMLNEVSLCHMENLSLDLAILMCRNFLYWHSVFPVAKRDSEASCLFLLSALFYYIAIIVAVNLLVSKLRLTDAKEWF